MAEQGTITNYPSGTGEIDTMFHHNNEVYLILKGSDGVNRITALNNSHQSVNRNTLDSSFNGDNIDGSAILGSTLYSVSYTHLTLPTIYSV